jgi:cyanophycinase
MCAQILGSRQKTFRLLLGTSILAGTGSVAFLGLQLAFLSPRPELHARTTPSIPTTAGGSLVICGGGALPDPVRDRFFELAGGRRAKIVVIPTASMAADRPGVTRALDIWRERKPEWVELLHTRSRELADDPTFVKPLTEATGVWIGGGDQARLTQAYLGTAVERQLMALLNRGGVIGGTSAGAAVMTRVMIANGRDRATVSPGFDFLPGVVVDQHFLRRNRLTRLVGVLADHPELIGLGIDEKTALEVHLRDRRMRVIGDSYVFACVPDTAGHPARLEILNPGDETDLAALKDKEPGRAIVSAIDVKAL